MTTVAMPTGYRSAQARDGSWSVYEVPIFAECVDERGVEPVVYDYNWLRGAFDAAQARFSEGYMAPLHVRHHGSDEVTAAGHFRIVALRQITYEGVKRWALIANLVGVPDQIYREIRRGGLPYRSVEIHKVDRTEIDSLALLDHEVPFFRFELLRISDEIPLSEAEAAMRAGAPRPRLLFNNGCAVWSGSMSKPVRNPVSVKLEDEHQKKDEDEEKKGEDEEKRGAIMDDDAPPAPPVAGALTPDALEAIKAVVFEAVKAAMGAMGAMGVPEDQPPVQPGATPVEVRAAAAPAAMAEGRRSTKVVEAEMRGMVSALQARVEKAERAVRVDRKRAELLAAGFAPAQVMNFAMMAEKDGEAAAFAYAKGLEAARPVEPPTSWTGELRPADAPEADPPEVAAYAKAGPEVLDNARRLARAHKSMRSRFSLGEFLAANLAGSVQEFLSR